MLAEVLCTILAVAGIKSAIRKDIGPRPSPTATYCVMGHSRPRNSSSSPSKSPSTGIPRPLPLDQSVKDPVALASGTVYPGDGIRPSVSEFNEVLNASYNAWSSADFALTEDQPDLFCIDSFLKLVENVPAFTAPPSTQVCVRQTEDELIVECALQWKTTEHPE